MPASQPGRERVFFFFFFSVAHTAHPPTMLAPAAARSATWRALLSSTATRGLQTATLPDLPYDYG